MGFRAALYVGLTLAFVAQIAQASVVSLTEATFDKATKENVWFVEFYAPWCGHCKKLAPIFEQIPNDPQISGAEVRVAKVDCTTERGICERMGVQSYPTLKVVTSGRFYDYSGKRELVDMVQFATTGYKKSPSEQVLTKGEFLSQKAIEEEERAKVERNSAVVHITSATFEDLVKDSKDPWIIKFYAPWCGHCKRLAPTWNKLSISLKESGSNTRVAKVDCTVHRRVCSRFNVGGYPTLLYINDGTVYKYKGGRSLNAFIDFVNGEWEKADSIGPIPDESFLSNIVDGAIEWATEHTVMAILAGILLIAIFVAILVALLDYCLGDNDVAAYQEAQHGRPAKAKSKEE